MLTAVKLPTSALPKKGLASRPPRERPRLLFSLATQANITSESGNTERGGNETGTSDTGTLHHTGVVSTDAI